MLFSNFKFGSIIREENDKLVKVLNSRVMDCSTEAGERLFADYPGRTVDHGIVCFRKSSYCAALNLSKWIFFHEQKMLRYSIKLFWKQKVGFNRIKWGRVQIWRMESVTIIPLHLNMLVMILCDILSLDFLLPFELP